MIKGKIKFNINHYVYVKLTDMGRDIFLKDANYVYLMTGQEPKYNNIEDIEWYKVDEDGFVRFQLWGLMEMFGEHTHIGFSSCFDTEIYFNLKDLEEK